MTPLRVGSLLPSATEIVASLGFGDAAARPRVATIGWLSPLLGGS